MVSYKFRALLFYCRMPDYDSTNDTDILWIILITQVYTAHGVWYVAYYAEFSNLPRTRISSIADIQHVV